MMPFKSSFILFNIGTEKRLIPILIFNCYNFQINKYPMFQNYYIVDVSYPYIVHKVE